MTACFSANVGPKIQPHGNMMENTGTGCSGIKDITEEEKENNMKGKKCWKCRYWVKYYKFQSVFL